MRGLRNLRGLSTSDAAAADKDGGANKSRQSFVTTEIEPGEWDVQMKDPLHRPKYRSRAKILSRHDYARLNGVTFEEQYQTFEDAMITLSWMDHKTKERIYQNYLNWMVSAQEKFGKTSHEYVCRLLAQKFHITPFRAAAIIQLMHLEEQMKMENPEGDMEDEFGDQAEIVDQYMMHTINEAYRSTGETPPEAFVEPVDMAGGLESYKTTAIDDALDVDQLTRDANVREQENARIMINDHVYIEDVDDEAIKIPMSKDAMGLINMKEKLAAQAGADPPPSPTAAAAVPEEGRRPRWKFVAQAIDTRILNPKQKHHYSRDGKKYRGKRHKNRFQQDWAENTLIEEQGELRPANLADVRHLSWKPVRHLQEFTYSEAKSGWLERTVGGNNAAWGKAPIYKGLEKKKEFVDTETNVDVDEADVDKEDPEATDELATSDSSSDSEGESSSDEESSSDDEPEKEVETDDDDEDDDNDPKDK